MNTVCYSLFEQDNNISNDDNIFNVIIIKNVIIEI